MLSSVGYTQLRQNLAENLAKVERGETVLVQRRGKIVAKIVPVAAPPREKSWKKPFSPIKVQGSLMAETIRQMRDAESW